MRYLANINELRPTFFVLALGALLALTPGCVAGDMGEEADDGDEEATAEAASEIYWNGHSYWFRAEPVTWSTAKTGCTAKPGYHLVTINGDSEQNFLHQQIQIEGGWWWIGFNDADKNGIWSWVSGSPIYTANWAPYQPGNYNCALMKQDGKWYGGWCNGGERRYICERNY